MQKRLFDIVGRIKVRGSVMASGGSTCLQPLRKNPPGQECPRSVTAGELLYVDLAAPSTPTLVVE